MSVIVIQNNFQYEHRYTKIGENISKHWNQFHVGKSMKRYGGRPTVLSQQEEEEIVITCQVLQEMGFGMTQEMVANVIMEYIQDKGLQSTFANGKPAWQWLVAGIHVKVAKA